MRIKYENPKLKQSEKAKQLSCSSSTLQRFRNDINMLSPYRIQLNNTKERTKNISKTNIDDNSHRKNDLKIPQMTSKDFVKAETNTKTNKRNKLKGGDPYRTNFFI